MNILITGFFPDCSTQRIIDAFPEEWNVNIAAPEKSYDYIHGADVIIPEHITVDASLLNRAPNLKLVQTGAGYDNVDLAECRRRGICVCSSGGINSGAVAEHTMALILSWYKNIPYLDSFMKSGYDESGLCYNGAELEGKTIGIVGLGSIGQKVAAMCMAFGIKVIANSIRPKEISGVKNVSFEELLRSSDIISLHVPCNQSTVHLICCESFKKMERTPLLVNTSRGAVICEKDLADALTADRISGACLDVFEDEPLPSSSRLREFPNVILTPHTAGYPDGVKYHEKRYAFFAENIRRIMSGQTPFNCLN